MDETTANGGLAALRDLAADIARSLDHGDEAEAAPPHPREDFADRIIAALAEERCHRTAFDRRLAAQEELLSGECLRADDATRRIGDLARLLRDIERQLTTLRVHTDRLVSAVDLAASAA